MERLESLKLNYITKSALLGEVINWVIQLSPYIPENLTDIAKAVDAYIEQNHEKGFKYKAAYSDMVMLGYESQNSIHTFLYDMTHNLPELKVLNLSKRDKDQGLTVDDVDKERGFVFTDRYTSIKKDCDFVDLGALARNISNAIKWDREREKAFDDSFEARHGKLDPKDY